MKNKDLISLLKKIEIEFKENINPNSNLYLLINMLTLNKLDILIPIENPVGSKNELVWSNQFESEYIQLSNGIIIKQNIIEQLGFNGEKYTPSSKEVIFNYRKEDF